MRRCLVADDHPGVVRALSELLAASGFDIETAENGSRAVEVAAARPPDCAVVDYRMPDLDGPELVARLRAAAPAAAIVVYTAEVSGSLGADALAAGADAVVLKDSPLADILRALRLSRRGSSHVDPGLVRAAAARPRPPISPREREVLTLVSEGLDYADIGCRLGIGAETCRSHVKNACERLGATTRTEAVAKALRLGWIA
jgi:DNA-binding NarL/FixJ family response regulator